VEKPAGQLLLCTINIARLKGQPFWDQRRAIFD
jgi:hypothetical protein